MSHPELDTTFRPFYQGCETSSSDVSASSVIPASGEGHNSSCIVSNQFCDPILADKIPTHEDLDARNVSRNDSLKQDQGETIEAERKSPKLPEFTCDKMIADQWEESLAKAVEKLAQFVGRIDYFPRGPAGFSGWNISQQMRLRVRSSNWFFKSNETLIS
jgi:hypothetical protein